MKNKLIKIGEAAKLLGTSVGTLRKWESTGELLPARKTKGGTRYYDLAELTKSSPSIQQELTEIKNRLTTVEQQLRKE